MRLAVVIAGLAGGGAERVASQLAGELSRRGNAVSLVTFHGSESEFYEVDAGIAHTRLGLDGGGRGLLGRLRNELTLLRRLRRTLLARRPDAAIAFSTETGVRTLVATVGTGIRVIASERTDPARHDPGVVWRMLRRHLYRFAHAVVVQTEDAADWIARDSRGARITVIPNSIMLQDAGGDGAMPRLPRPRVVGLGRFRPEKGFDQLLEAFARLHEAHPQWHLVLGGDGPEEPRLRAIVARHGMESRVHFAGPISDPAAFFREADVFALPSHYEGFPNALLEAMACGVPAVSFDSVGARAIVAHGVDGLLAPAGDVAALAQQLAALMGDESLRCRLGSAARTVRERFAPDQVTAQWLEVVA